MMGYNSRPTTPARPASRVLPKLGVSNLARATNLLKRPIPAGGKAPSVAKAPKSASSIGIKRKLDGPDSSASSPPAKFVRGPGVASSRPVAVKSESESSKSTPKPAGIKAVAPKPVGAFAVNMLRRPAPKPVAANQPASIVKKSKAAPTAKPRMATSSPSDSAASREHRDPQLIKADVKARKVQAFAKHLLDEWGSLVEDRKKESWKEVAMKFKERVPSEFLEEMMACFTGSSPADPAVYALPDKGLVKTELSGDDPASFTDSMQEVFNLIAEKEPQELNDFWSSLAIPKPSIPSALTAFLQVVMDCGDAQGAASFLQHLLTAKLVQPSALELALTNTAKKLEELTQVNESAWHVHAHVLMKTFPKTTQTPWGYFDKGWTWWMWWQMVDRTLSSADSFRAFDILVLVLQMMQEQSGFVVKEQSTWKDQARIQKVRATLCAWGDMDETALLETLTAYGVEL